MELTQRSIAAGCRREEWSVCSFSDLCQLQRGFDITEATRKSGTVPVYSSSGLAYFHDEARVQPPAVITGRKGLLGKVFYSEDACWPHDTTLWVKDFKKNDPKFVYWFLTHWRLERFDAATSVPTLNRNNLVSLPVAVPPLPEQKAIAAALSDVDALLGALDRLIAKKRDLKQAAMQQLLTGQTRLPGFSGKWNACDILGVCRSIIDYRGRTPKKLGMDWGGDIPALSARNVKMGYIDFNEECYFGSPELYRRWMTSGDVARNDIVITLEAPLGNVALIPDDRQYILSQRTVLLQPEPSRASSHFIFHYLMSTRFQSLLLENATGSTAQGIQRRKFERLPISLPSVGEQSAIAGVLSDMDAELTALEQRRDKTRLLKQGMMQELLTGRTRLV